MLNAELLKSKINKSGISITAIASKLGLSREAVYHKMKGKSEFSATEIVVLTEVLHLSRDERDKIFLTKKLN